MKKSLFATFLFTILFMSCGGSADKGSENVDSQQEAGHIIGYTNNVIDYLNESNSWMRSNDGRIEAMVTYMETGKKASVFLPFVPNVSMNRHDKDALNTPPAVMSVEEKEFFSSNMTEYRKSFKQLLEDCGVLYKYIQNQDYKDDDFAKGKELSDSIKSKYNYLTVTKSALYDKIDEVTEKAEEIILSNHVLKDPIMTLKAEMKSLESLNGVYIDYSNGEATPEVVDAAYQAAAASIEENKVKYADLLEEQNVKSKYEYFYKKCDGALSAYRRILRDVKDKKKIRDSEFKSFTSDYNSIVNAYNSFVN